MGLQIRAILLEKCDITEKPAASYIQIKQILRRAQPVPVLLKHTILIRSLAELSSYLFSKANIGFLPIPHFWSYYPFNLPVFSNQLGTNSGNEYTTKLFYSPNTFTTKMRSTLNVQKFKSVLRPITSWAHPQPSPSYRSSASFQQTQQNIHSFSHCFCPLLPAGR